MKLSLFITYIISRIVSVVANCFFFFLAHLNVINEHPCCHLAEQ